MLENTFLKVLLGNNSVSLESKIILNVIICKVCYLWKSLLANDLYYVQCGSPQRKASFYETDIYEKEQKQWV